jgi:hypothetical protein
MSLPDNISHLLGVDFSGNIVSLEASLFATTTVNQTNINVPDSRIPDSPEEVAKQAISQTIIKEITKNIENGFVSGSDGYYIPLTNFDKTNFVNSSLYQSGIKIGINTLNPQYLLDVKGGSINITTTDDISTYGFKIDGYNIAYKDIINGLIFLGNDTDLDTVSLNTLLLRGLIPTTPLGENRYLTINDSGIVSATTDVNATRIKVKVRNSTGSTIYKGMIVYMNGSTGNRPTVALSRANSEATSARTFGAAFADIPNNTDGYVVVIGNIDTLDTRSNATHPFTTDTLVDGDTLYLSPTNAGYVTNVKPSAPNHLVYIGKVVRTTPTNGTIEYQIQNGYELDELHDVAITSKTNKDFIYYDSTTNLWKNSQFDAIMTIGGEVSGTYGNITLINSAVTAKILTGLNTLGGGSIGASDSILAAFGKLQNQLNALSGSVIYQGVWNATTNTPTLTSSVGTKGFYYKVNVAGSTNLDGITDWKVGDWVIFNGTTWDKIDNTDSVSSVNGFTGAVSLTTDNVPEGVANKYYTDARARLALSATTPLNYNSSTGVFTISQSSGSVNGFLSSTDWNTFNNKQDALINPTTGTGTANYLTKWTSANALGASGVFESGGSLGIGTTSLTGVNLAVSKNISGGANSYGIIQNGVVQSTVSTVNGFFNTSNTQATTFTLPNYRHFTAYQGTIGVGSSITFQSGFFVDSTLIGATNNYGFYGNIPSGSGRWNLYMGGTAPNYLAGSLGIGTTNSATQLKLSIGGNITGGVNAYGVDTQVNILSDVTTQYRGYRSSFSTQAAAFTLPTVIHFGAYQSTIGAGSSVTNQYGFFVDSSMSGAGSNYAFYSSLSAASNSWNLYMAGTANNYLAGNLGIGATALTTTNLSISKGVTGGTIASAVVADGSILSDVTSLGLGFSTFLNTQQATFTLNSYRHFHANQGAIRTGSVVANQYGFYANSGLTGATNNYGFFGDIASGTGRWNLYMSGTANNYLAGNLSIGTTTTTYKLNWQNGTNFGFLGLTTGGAVAGSTGLFEIWSGATPASRLRVDSAGLVSIGRGTLVIPDNLTVGNSTATTLGITSNRQAGTTASPKYLDLNFRGYFDDIMATIRSWDESASTSNGFLTFSVRQFTGGVATLNERMRIAPTGNVGIGTTTPVYRLHVVNSGNALLQLNGSNTTGALGTGFTISADSSKNIYLYQRENAAAIFGTNNAERLRISATGNVSIGNTNNTYKLDVSGTINATALRITGGLATQFLMADGSVTASSSITPSARTLTINGTAYDLSLDRTWSVGTVTSVSALTLTTTGTDITSSVTTGTATPVITLNIPTASATNRGALSSADWTTFNNKVSTARTLTINGITFDLSADRSWSIATGSVGGSGATNYVAKWINSNTLGTGAIYDTGTNVSIGNIPATSYRFNIANISGTRFISYWEPTVSGVSEIGILAHKGGGLFDQAPLLFNASEIFFSTGITTRFQITSSTILVNGTSGVSGGGALQVAGNVNITGNFQINGVNIGGGGGGVSNLFQLNDVSISSPSNGQALVYRSSDGKWINSTISSGGGAVSSVFGRTGAVVAQSGDYNITQLSGVSISSPSNGQLLQFNGTNWVNATVSTGGGVNNLFQLLDVNIVSVSNDQVLSYNSSTGKWQNKAFVSAPVTSVFGRTGAVSANEGDYTLNLLGDVTISSPSNGQVLQYNGSQWINSSISTSGVGGSGSTNFIAMWSNTTTLTNSIMSYNSTNVEITVSGILKANAFYENSDLRLKNLIPLREYSSLDSLGVISYTFKDDSNNKVRFGYSAQEVRRLIKELCLEDEKGYLSVSYTEIHTLKIKRLEERVEELEKQLNLR